MPDGLTHEDAALIQAARQGDKEAFGLLYERHASSVFRYLYAHMGEREDAEDLTEEVFMNVWRALPNYDERGLPFQAYLFRVGRNALIDHYRQRKVFRPIPEIMKDDRHEDPEDAAHKNMERSTLFSFMGELSEDYRQVLVLRFLSGLSPQETAAVLQRSEAAIRVLQHRALQALRKLLVSEARDG